MQTSDAGMSDGGSKGRTYETTPPSAAESASGPLDPPSPANEEGPMKQEDSELEGDDDSYRARSRGSVSRPADDYD